MEQNIDNLLCSRNTSHKEEHADRYIDHYLEQYRIYLHIFNSTHDRSSKSNDFFLGLNAAIIAALGFLETKGIVYHNSIIFMFAPFIGIAICYCWYQIINSYRKLNKAKFKVIEGIEKGLPITLFATEWEILGNGKDKKKYYPLSKIEEKIPIIFIVLYILIFIMSLSTSYVINFLK